MKLNIGCGNKRMDGFLGVDRYSCEAVALLCDISRSLPFANQSIEEFYLDNVIEHIMDIPSLMREIFRVARPGAIVTIITPHFTSMASWRAPDHFHHFSYFTFDLFGKESSAYYTKGGGFEIVHRRLTFGGGILGLFGRLIFAISPEMYEKRFCFIFQASTLHCRLRVVKPNT
jgi:SAM-dependent methyltransferase